MRQRFRHLRFRFGIGDIAAGVAADRKQLRLEIAQRRRILLLERLDEAREQVRQLAFDTFGEDGRIVPRCPVFKIAAEKSENARGNERGDEAGEGLHDFRATAQRHGGDAGGEYAANS